MRFTTALAFVLGFAAGAASLVALGVLIGRTPPGTSGEGFDSPTAEVPNPAGLEAVPPTSRPKSDFDPAAALFQCTVAGVLDGDTIECAEGATRVRLLLIDSPEQGQGQYYYASRDFLVALMPAGTVTALEIDEEMTDSYGRVLAYVWLPDGRMANEVITRAGLALLFQYSDRNVRHLRRIEAAQWEAQQAGAGRWARGDVGCPPASFRRQLCRGFD